MTERVFRLTHACQLGRSTRHHLLNRVATLHPVLRLQAVGRSPPRGPFRIAGSFFVDRRRIPGAHRCTPDPRHGSRSLIGQP